MFTTRDEIKTWLESVNIKNYIINEDLSVDITGNTDISSQKIKRFPVQFGIIYGDFDCSHNELTTLKGSPSRVRNFNCSYNDIISLEGMPENISLSLNCSYNKIVSLEIGEVNLNDTSGKKIYKSLLPHELKGDFNCSHNNLTSLNGSVEVVKGKMDCSYNQLLSLEGMAQSVGRKIDCSHNQLKSLAFSPKEVFIMNCSNNQLVTLEHAPKKVRDVFNCSYNELTSLKGAPTEVGGNFNCSHNNLFSLENLPQKIVADLLIHGNNIKKWDYVYFKNKEILGDIVSDKQDVEEVKDYYKKWKIVKSSNQPETDFYKLKPSILIAYLKNKKLAEILEDSLSTTKNKNKSFKI